MLSHDKCETFCVINTFTFDTCLMRKIHSPCSTGNLIFQINKVFIISFIHIAFFNFAEAIHQSGVLIFYEKSVFFSIQSPKLTI